MLQKRETSEGQQVVNSHDFKVDDCPSEDTMRRTEVILGLLVKIVDKIGAIFVKIKRMMLSCAFIIILHLYSLSVVRAWRLTDATDTSHVRSLCRRGLCSVSLC